MHKKWLEYLVDPEDRQPLVFDGLSEDGSGCVDGVLRSVDGVRTYDAVRGIPRFVSKELYQDSLTSTSDEAKTGRSFGEKWNQESFHSYGNTAAEVQTLGEQFFAMLGVSDDTELKTLFRDGMQCLNAGCGVAWSEYLFNVNEKVNRFAVDLSLSVEVAYNNTRSLDNVCVAQADLFELPFRDEFFDIVFSNGVLHHTGDAGGSFDALCRHLKPGGLIGIYVYCTKPFLRELADREIRSITTRMSFEECVRFSEQITKLGRSLQKIQEKLVVEEDIPALDIKKGEYPLQQFVYDHFLKCYHNGDIGFDISVLTNVDWYHPLHASHHTKVEVEGWFERNDIVDVRFRQPPGWEHSGFFVSGRKHP